MTRQVVLDLLSLEPLSHHSSNHSNHTLIGSSCLIR